MRNWLREDGGPVFYGYSNRTSVTGDISMVACCLVFLTLYTAFLIIFPGIRKQVIISQITQYRRHLSIVYLAHYVDEN